MKCAEALGLAALERSAENMRKIAATSILAIFIALIVSCNREYVDGRLITSYSIKTRTEEECDIVEKDFQVFLDKKGMQKALAEEAHDAGFHGEGDTTVRWNSRSAPFSITVTKSQFPKNLSGDIAWEFRGPKEDWLVFKAELQEFQDEVIDWFKKRPELEHKESTYWDGSL